MLRLMVRRVFLRMLRRISKDHRKNKQPNREWQEIADHFLSIVSIGAIESLMIIEQPHVPIA